MLLNAAAPTPLDFVNRVLNTSSRAVRDAWRHVGPRAVEGASTGRVFAAFLHVFVTAPFVIAAIDLALLVARAAGERLFAAAALLAYAAVALAGVVGVTLFVAGALIGAAGVLTGMSAHRVHGQVTMAAGIVAGAAFVTAGDFVPGWTTVILCVGALAAQTVTWAFDRREP